MTETAAQQPALEPVQQLRQGLTEEWLTRFAAVTWQAVRVRRTGAACCVSAARVGAGVAKRLGVAAVPQPVRVVISTRDFFDTSGRHGRSVGTRATGRIDRHGWDGHLGLYLAERWWVDLSADQFSRPEHGIVIGGPVIIEATRDRLATGVSRRLGGPLHNAGHSAAGAAGAASEVVYSVKAVDDQQWRRLHAWTSNPRPVRQTVHDAVRAIHVHPGQHSGRHSGRQGADPYRAHVHGRSEQETTYRKDIRDDR